MRGLVLRFAVVLACWATADRPGEAQPAPQARAPVMQSQAPAQAPAAPAGVVPAQAPAAQPAVPAVPASPPPRLALVVGEGAYPRGPLKTAANDAGLVARTLVAAGFTVTGARDLDAKGLRGVVREFLERSAAAGPDATVFIYLAGYGLQLDGQTYFLPVDASPQRETEIPAKALRLGDITRGLGKAPLKARVVVLDAAYHTPFVKLTGRIAPGLGLSEPGPGWILAYNSAPGTLAPKPEGSYGTYAQALAEMMRGGGVPAEDVFDRVRLRVNADTGGAAVPWDGGRIGAPLVFFERSADAPALASAQQSFSAMAKRTARDFPAEEAYGWAVGRDTVDAYADFLAAYPDSPYARRVRTLAAVRREALTWRAALARHSPEAIWTYLARYPTGPHLLEARRRLTALKAAATPPSGFAELDLAVAPPPATDAAVFGQPTVVLTEPGDAPPPPPPLMFVPPRVAAVTDEPPRPPSGPHELPLPPATPIPYVRATALAGSIEPPGSAPARQASTGSVPAPVPDAPARSLVELAQPSAGAAPAPAPASLERPVSKPPVAAASDLAAAPVNPGKAVHQAEAAALTELVTRTAVPAEPAQHRTGDSKAKPPRPAKASAEAVEALPKPEKKRQGKAPAQPEAARATTRPSAAPASAERTVRNLRAL